MENNETVPHMKSLALCLNRMVLDGYDDDFKVVDGQLTSLKTDRKFAPEEVNIVNFFRFEGQSDPDDMTIMYVIEAPDGIKGTMVDAFGVYANTEVGEFFKKVEQINKKTEKSEIKPA